MMAAATERVQTGQATRPEAETAGGPWVGGVTDLVAGVASGSRLSVSGFHFTRAPMAQLRALATTGVGDLHYIAWGGGLPLEFLLDNGMVSRATLCFSSLDVFGPAPRFRRAVEDGRLELAEWTALGIMNGLRAAGENLPFEVLHEPAGSSLTSAFSGRLADPLGGDGAPVVAVAPLPLDVLLLHAQRADDDGNVEIAGARGFDMPAIFAARRVLVTVEERVSRGQLGAARSFIVPRTFVDRVALAPSGAYPTSCLPYYPADLRSLRRIVDAGADAPLPRESLEVADERRRTLSVRASLPADNVAAAVRAHAGTEGPTSGYTVDELMVAVLARSIEPAGVCSVGAASPLPTAAYFLAKHLYAPDVLVMSHNGGLVDLPVRPLTLASAEQLDHHLAAAHTGGDETYHWYYQRGLVSHEVVGSAQVDGRGGTNNIWVSKRSGQRVRLPGQGGMADVANLHANFMVYLPRQSPRNTPAELELVSAQRDWHRPDQRRRYGLRPGRMMLLTDLAIFEYDVGAGRLLLRSLHPGVSVEQVQEQTGFEVVPAERVATTPEPTADELHALRTVIDPIGIRRLDLVGSAERQALIDQILELEEKILDNLTVERP